MRFGKYHGLGNDFLVVDLRDPEVAAGTGHAGEVPSPAVVRALCERRFGIGADGIMAVLPALGDGDARLRVLNSDGSEAEMCGNGLRCVVKYLGERDPALRGRETLNIETGAGLLRCRAHRSDTALGDGGIAAIEQVTVDMGRPRLERAQIPMHGPAEERCISEPLAIAGRPLDITAVSMGNPHAIAFVDVHGAEQRALAELIGPSLERHPWFPRHTNVELAHLRRAPQSAADDDGDSADSPTVIELVVWERGCGITLACGTGACATAVAACLTGRARPGEAITVHLLGGPLAITVGAELDSVRMRGPATHVFDGVVPASLLRAAAA
ncbi:diaminopimelate epimerase [Haliangium ochraceum]|uniref:Diaminopimelate epimerase n=1 Tax=Haliangium ochraceum (strain DSM 14365 / JCM 11303 / SMP-2) TaxID=502025 RepID=D0LTS4_HALO1|nr:diaminopimelate epimerase [Haliangium ochraceum]ACY15768.1 diaminopimelate epimerase [Haliangium ochraceum DSM 14365]